MTEQTVEPWQRVDFVKVTGPVAVIGDVHGRLDLLSALVAKLDAMHPRGAMPLFVVGDVCDRGPDTKGVIELLVRRGARGVRGNHEEWICDWASGCGFDKLALAPIVGGRATLDSYGVTSTSTAEIEAASVNVPATHRAWLEGLPLAMRLEVDKRAHWIVHAGVAEHLVSGDDSVADMLLAVQIEAKGMLWTSLEPHQMGRFVGAPVISGHVPRREPVLEKHAIVIDTGCGVWPDGRLTAVVLPSRQIVSVGPETVA